MFFLRMIGRSFGRQLRRRVLVAVTVCLSACVAVSMLGIVFDVGDKLNAELSTYGSNIIVQPKADAVVSELYGEEWGKSSAPQDPTAFLKESDAVKIKTIFWAYNITNFAPQLTVNAEVSVEGDKPAARAARAATASQPAVADAQDAREAQVSMEVQDIPNARHAAGDPKPTKEAESAQEVKATAASPSAPGRQVSVVGTWFSKQLTLSSGESAVVGVRGMRSWWKVEGDWAKDGSDQAMVGRALASSLGVRAGQRLRVVKNGTMRSVTVVGIYDSGDDDENAVYVPSGVAQDVAGLPDRVNRIEVKALTTPENDLARKAARNPAALSQDEWETWYCTAYPSSIAYQIEEVLPDAVAKQVRQVAALQGSVLSKTSAVMVLMTALSLLAAAVAVANLMAASMAERSSELALLKAVGATNGAVSRLMLMETAVTALLGAVAGSVLGAGVAQVVGHVVFGAGIIMRPMVFVLVFVLLAVTVLLASALAIRSILSVRPAEVLHGR